MFARCLAISGISVLGLVFAARALGANALIKMFLHVSITLIVYKKNLLSILNHREKKLQFKEKIYKKLYFNLSCHKTYIS